MYDDDDEMKIKLVALWMLDVAHRVKDITVFCTE